MRAPLRALVAGIALSTSGCAASGLGGMGGCGMGGGGGHGGHERAPARIERASCPVCGTELTVAEQTPRATYEGSLYYFVSEDHERLFLAAPEQYLERAEERAPVPEPEEETGHQHH